MVGVLMILAGCGSTSQATTSSPTPAPALPSPVRSAAPQPAVVIDDAAQLRDRLLGFEPVGIAVPSSGDMTAKWTTNIPGLAFVGSSVKATAYQVSGFAYVVSKKKNLQYLAFAVLDAADTCAGGVLEASGAGDKVTRAASVMVPAGTACQGSKVSELGGY